MATKRSGSISRIIISLLGLCLLVFGIAQLFLYLNTGADRGQLFKEDRLVSEYNPELSWKSQNLTNWEISTAQQVKITQDYLRSWSIKTHALAQNTLEFLPDGFTAAPRQKLEAAIRFQLLENSSQQQVSLAHRLELQFISDDGKIVQFIDREVLVYTKNYLGERLLAEQRSLQTFNVIMFLQDGFWRIRHQELLEIKPAPQRQTQQLITQGVKGINYYPQASPWDTFGDAFSEDTLIADFTIIKSLGANTIRVFVPYFDFGQDTVKPQKLEKLNTLLNRAEQANLKVIITLFDFYGDYRMERWQADIAHLKTIVNAVKNHPAIHSWDIKNEPDLDYESRTKTRVNSWLQQMIYSLHETGVKQPITIGWSTPEAAVNLSEVVDYVSFHYYQKPKDLKQALEQLRTKTTKNLVMQEFGRSTNRGFWAPFGMSETGQEAYYQDILTTVANENLGLLAWTLYDFDTIPSQVSGWQPWRKNKQASFGILDKQGAPKPAYATLKSKFTNTTD